MRSAGRRRRNTQLHTTKREESNMNVRECHRTSPWTDVLDRPDDADPFGRSTTPPLRVEDVIEDHASDRRVPLAARPAR
jgi:hypothetical protein